MSRRRSIQSLVRLQKFRLDELRRDLAELEGRRRALLAQDNELHAQLLREQMAAAQADEVTTFYRDFAVRIGDTRARIAEAIVQVEEQVENLRERMSEAYQDTKKFEIAEDVMRQQERREADRREQVALDEIGLQFHQRNKTARPTG